jgi:hypothetical protein
VVAKTIWNKGKADAGFLLLLERERERACEGEGLRVSWDGKKKPVFFCYICAG